MSLFNNYKKNEHNGVHYKTQFELHNIPIYLANSIRRGLSSINPVTTFDDKYEEVETNRSVNIKKNTSALHDQFLSHRLSLVPINMELNEHLNIKTSFEYITGLRRYEFVDDKPLIFNIDAINNISSIDDRDKDGLISITSNNFTITTGEGNLIDNNLLFQKDVFTQDHILIDKLKFNINDPEAGEELRMECYPTIGFGKDNSRYDPTGTVTFQLKIDEGRVDEVFDNKIYYLNVERKVKDLPELTVGEKTALRRSFDLLDKERVHTTDSVGNPNIYLLSVESIGFMNSDSMIYNTICSLHLMIKDILNSFELSITDADKCIGFTTNKKVTVTELESDNVNEGININIDNENHTIGNLLSMYMRDLFVTDGSNLDLDVLKYVAYKMQHPAIEEIDIIIVPKDNKKATIIQYIGKLLHHTVHDLDATNQQIELEKKDTKYLNTLLSVLLFLKTINSCSSMLLQIKQDFIKSSGFNTTYENAGYIVDDTEEYFSKNTNIVANLSDITEEIDYSNISTPFNTL